MTARLLRAFHFAAIAQAEHVPRYAPYPLAEHVASPLVGPAAPLPPQALIIHLQYFVIIARLDVAYPGAITACMSAFSSLTWAGDLLGFSPACLARDLDSGSQATAQLLGGLLMPCAVVLLSLALWALR